MKKFSQITEIRSSQANDSLLHADINQFLSKLQKKLPYTVQKVLYLTQKYDITSAEELEEIKSSPKGKLKNLVDKYNISSKDLEDLWSMLGSLKDDAKLLPHFMDTATRDALMSGKLSPEDITIDLTTKQGQNAAIKMYTPLIWKIVNQYLGRSRLDKNDLLSAAMLGFSNAMKDWKPVPDEGGKVVPFKTYASYRVQQQILNDINKYGHSLSGTNSYASKEYDADLLDAVSIDALNTDMNIDSGKLAFLGIEDKPSDGGKYWEKLYSVMEKTFSQRDMDVFYRYFGLNGRKREKSKDIAKSLNMSEGNIKNSIINKILKWLRSNPKAKDILSDLQDIYTESLMCEMVGLSASQIIEMLTTNDVYILLEELNRWKNANVFNRAFGEAITKIPDSQVIIDALSGNFLDLDNILKPHRKTIILFLSAMYPTESFNKKTDVELLEYLKEIQEAYKKINKIK